MPHACLWDGHRRGTIVKLTAPASPPLEAKIGLSPGADTLITSGVAGYDLMNPGAMAIATTIHCATMKSQHTVIADGKLTFLYGATTPTFVTTIQTADSRGTPATCSTLLQGVAMDPAKTTQVDTQQVANKGDTGIGAARCVSVIGVSLVSGIFDVTENPGRFMGAAGVRLTTTGNPGAVVEKKIEAKVDVTQAGVDKKIGADVEKMDCGDATMTKTVATKSAAADYGRICPKVVMGAHTATQMAAGGFGDQILS